MIVALDANCLVKWSSTRADNLDRVRLEHLLATVSAAAGKIIIPTPSFAEYLVKTDAASSEWMAGLERKRAVFLAPFDRRAAFECALIDRAALGSGDKKQGRTDSWSKIKVDRQIIAIARTNQATVIVTDDEGLRSTAQSVGLIVHRAGELELPASALQRSLQWNDPHDSKTTTAPAQVVPVERDVSTLPEVAPRESIAQPNSPPSA